MIWSRPGSLTFVPDGLDPEEALRRTAHLGIGAHSDDLEFMAWHPILECLESSSFTGVTVTDSRGSARTGLYAGYSDEEMRDRRVQEQKQAATIGRYSALIWLDYQSADLRQRDSGLQAELVKILQLCRPHTVWTHNLADKHDTHIALALAVIRAVRELPAGERPRALYGCEVWRGLDWLPDELKLSFDVSEQQNLTMALMGLYDSQISGGKRYDLATQGRKRANATYHASHVAGRAQLLEFVMDMSPLLEQDDLTPETFIARLILSFADDVSQRLGRCQG